MSKPTVSSQPLQKTTLVSADEKIRVIVCCGVKGKIKLFLEYLNILLSRKGSFEYVFCIGDFFSDDENCEKEWKQHLESRKTLPVPIYILGPNKKEHAKYFENLVEQQLAPSIFYLGKHGVFTTSKGFNIGYISGIQGPFQGIESEIHTFNYDSLEEFKESFVRSGKKMHMLLTSPWPADIRNNDLINVNEKIPECTDKDCVSNLLSWIAINLTPAYHFSGLQGLFYERSPFRSANNQVTRFIGLGNFFDKCEHAEQRSSVMRPVQKWLYGFSLTKQEPSDNLEMTFTTQSPYSTKSDYCVQPIAKQYFYKISANNSCRNNETHKNKKFKGSKQTAFEVNVDQCWFCLANKNISKHMLAVIGDQVYLAGSKGPLVKENLLIATIGHYKSFVQIPEEARLEVKVLKSSLNKYFQSSGCGAVYFERNILSAHFNIQVIPVPNSMVDRLEHAFKVKFNEYGLNLVEIPENALLHQIIRREGYFYLELPNGKNYLYTIDKNNKNPFPIHIAREVLASKSLLDVEDHIDWKKCKQTQSEESNDIETFKKAFEPFNRLKQN